MHKQLKLLSLKQSLTKYRYGLKKFIQYIKNSYLSKINNI